MKKVLLVILIITFSFRLWQTTGCRNFHKTNFEAQSIKISVEEQVNIDQGMSREVSRIFHNKLTSGFFEFAKSTLEALEPSVLLDILGPLGLFSITLAIYYLVKKPTPLKSAHFAAVLAVFLAIIFIKNTKLSFYMLAPALFSFSIWGIAAIKTKKLMVLGFFILTIITFWYFAFTWEMRAVCNEIFFN